MFRIMRILAQLAVLPLIAAVILGFFGWVHPALDTFSHFRLHLSVGLLGCVIALFFLRTPGTAIATLLVAVGGLYSALPGTVLSARALEANPDLPVYSLFHFNLLLNNPEKERVLGVIKKLDPDLVTVTEQSPEWRKQFEKIEGNWPHKYECRQSGQWNATTLYSKWPIEPGSEFCGVYSAMARVNLVAPDGRPLTFAAAHMRWPWPASGPEQLEILSPDIASFGNDAIVAGDFNAVTWSWAVRKFAALGGLTIVPGIGSTWMANEPVISKWFWAGLPIDNVMSKGAVRVLSAKTLEDIGSDHLPILVEFQLSR